MQSNKDIKKKQIFILKQKLIKQHGLVRASQDNLLCSIQECAYNELNKITGLKASISQLKLKKAIKAYVNDYMQKLVFEDDLRTLEDWKAND